MTVVYAGEEDVGDDIRRRHSAKTAATQDPELEKKNRSSPMIVSDDDGMRVVAAALR